MGAFLCTLVASEAVSCRRQPVFEERFRCQHETPLRGTSFFINLFAPRQEGHKVAAPLSTPRHLQARHHHHHLLLLYDGMWWFETPGTAERDTYAVRPG